MHAFIGAAKGVLTMLNEVSQPSSLDGLEELRAVVLQLIVDEKTAGKRLPELVPPSDRVVADLKMMEGAANVALEVARNSIIQALAAQQPLGHRKMNAYRNQLLSSMSQFLTIFEKIKAVRPTSEPPGAVANR
jgi:hypothetical protein